MGPGSAQSGRFGGCRREPGPRGCGRAARHAGRRGARGHQRFPPPGRRAATRDPAPCLGSSGTGGPRASTVVTARRSSTGGPGRRGARRRPGSGEAAGRRGSHPLGVRGGTHSVSRVGMLGAASFGTAARGLVKKRCRAIGARPSPGSLQGGSSMSVTRCIRWRALPRGSSRPPSRPRRARGGPRREGRSGAASRAHRRAREDLGRRGEDGRRRGARRTDHPPPADIPPPTDSLYRRLTGAMPT